MFQVQSVIGSSIPLLSHLEASMPKCFRQSRSSQTRQHGDAMSSCKPRSISFCKFAGYSFCVAWILVSTFSGVSMYHLFVEFPVVNSSRKLSATPPRPPTPTVEHKRACATCQQPQISHMPKTTTPPRAAYQPHAKRKPRISSLCWTNQYYEKMQ